MCPKFSTPPFLNLNSMSKLQPILGGDNQISLFNAFNFFIRYIMPHPFHHHDSLRLFMEIATCRSFSEAATRLNMTKGAISYQVKTLETALDVQLFHRLPRGVSLTEDGRRLKASCTSHYAAIEAELEELSSPDLQPLTVGMSSYFASRWLSPRLMTFMQDHPEIQLRIQPMTQLVDLKRQGVDLAVRWGNGKWDDATVSPFLPMPAWPVGNKDAAERVRRVGLQQAFSEFTLLRDHDHSNAWSDWFNAAGLPGPFRKDTLIIPDPNVRVQAVIDGQGIALNDDLVNRELEVGELVRLSEVELTSYGYFLIEPQYYKQQAGAAAFIKWLKRA